MGRLLLDVLRGERAEVENEGGRWLLWAPSRCVDGSSPLVLRLFREYSSGYVFEMSSYGISYGINSIELQTRVIIVMQKKNVYSHLYKCIIYGVVIVLIYVKYLSYVHNMDFL